MILFHALVICMTIAVVGYMVLPVFAGMVEWSGSRGRGVVGSPKQVVVVGGVAACLTFGGAGFSTLVTLLQSGVGGTSAGAVAPESASEPNTPTIDAFVISAPADSLRLLSSAFSGNGGTHDSTGFQVDTAGGDFSTPNYHDVTLGAVLTDTVISVDSGAVVVSRVRHKSSNGQWSAWSDSLSTTMVFSAVNADIDFAEDWGHSTGSDTAAITGNGNLVFNDFAGNTIGQEYWIVVSRADTLPSAPSDWSTNLIRFNFPVNDTATFLQTSATEFAVPAIGDTVYYRLNVHYQLDCTSSIGTNHGIQGRIGGQLNWYVHEICAGADSIDIGLGSDSYSNSYVVRLGMDKYYSLEWGWTRTGTSTAKAVKFDIIDEGAGSLLYDWSDLLNRTDSDALSADDPTITYDTNAAMWQQFYMGFSQSGGSNNCCAYYGMLAHSVGSPAGPYVSGEGN